MLNGYDKWKTEENYNPMWDEATEDEIEYEAYFSRLYCEYGEDYDAFDVHETAHGLSSLMTGFSY